MELSGSSAGRSDQGNALTCVCEALAKAVIEGKHFDENKWNETLKREEMICSHLIELLFCVMVDKDIEEFRREPSPQSSNPILTPNMSTILKKVR